MIEKIKDIIDDLDKVVNHMDQGSYKDHPSVYNRLLQAQRYLAAAWAKYDGANSPAVRKALENLNDRYDAMSDKEFNEHVQKAPEGISRLLDLEADELLLKLEEDVRAIIAKREIPADYLARAMGIPEIGAKQLMLKSPWSLITSVNVAKRLGLVVEIKLSPAETSP